MNEQFNNFYGEMDYGEQVRRFVPGYKQMIDLVIANLPIGVERMLDIGSGIGDVDERIMAELNPSQLVCIEPNKQMRDEAKKRLVDCGDRVVTHSCFAQDFNPNREKYDAVLTSLVLHNIKLAKKKKVIEMVYGCLKEEGVFIWSDLFNYGKSEEGRKKFETCLDARGRAAKHLGATDEFIAENREKELRDHMIQVREMISLLHSGSFREIEILWGRFNAILIKP